MVNTKYCNDLQQVYDKVLTHHVATELRK